MWWKILYVAIKRNGWRQLFFYLSNLDISRFIELSKTIEFLNDRRDTILELGCGYSVLPSILSKECKKYICLDLSKGACKYQSILPNVYVVIADMQYLPFKEGVIPTILAISSIEHVPNDEMVFKEISRISEKNAEIIVDVPYSNDDIKIKKMVRSRLLLDMLYKYSNFWKIILGRHIEYFFEQISTDSFMKYYNLDEIDRLTLFTDLYVKKYYLYEKWLQKRFFGIVPKGWFVLKDLFIGWILWKIEDSIFENRIEANGIITIMSRVKNE